MPPTCADCSAELVRTYEPGGAPSRCPACMAARRRPPRDPIVCENPDCEVVITAPRHTQRWCSRRCRQRVQDRISYAPELVRARNARSNAKRRLPKW